jgi:hypothetical protein
MTGTASEKQREHIRNYEAQRRAKGWVKATVWFSPEAVAALEKLKAALGSKDAAINAALVRAAAPPVQDTKAGPESAIESMQARRAKGPERPKTLSPTLPAGDPVKAATKAPERAGDDAPLRFPRAPIGSLVKSSHKPKR